MAEYVALVLAVLIICAFNQAREKAFERERESWAEERRMLLNRIQAPEAAQVVAAAELAWNRDPDPPMTEAMRIRRKAEEMGVSVDALRIPPGWGGSGW